MELTLETLLDAAELNIEKGFAGPDRVQRAQRALQLAQAAYDIDQNHPRKNLILATSYHCSSRYQEALLIYQRALELEPMNTTTLGNYGMALLRLGGSDNWQKAEELFTTAQKLEPENGILDYFLGLINQARNIPDQALSFYQKAKGKLNATESERDLTPEESTFLLKTSRAIEKMKTNIKFCSPFEFPIRLY